MEGHILAIKPDPATRAASSFRISSAPADDILFPEVIAVNGLFHSDYTEC